MKLSVHVLALALSMLSVPLAAQQGDRPRTEALARRAADRLQALHREADRLASEARTVLGDLRRLEVERQIKDEELRQAAANATQAAAELAALNEDLRRLQEQEQAARPQLRARLVELYKLGQGGYLRLWLSASDARQVAQASRMVAAVAERDRQRIALQQRRVEDLRRTRATLEERNTRFAALRAAAEGAQVAAARAVQDRNALIRTIDQRRDLNAQLAGELQAAQQRLQDTLRSLATGASGTAAGSAALPLAPFRGDLEWPASGPVRQRFGAAMSRSTQTTSSPNGIEITATVGAPVRVVHDGTVAFADTFSGYGKLVIVDHGAQNFSLYGHLLDITVARGDRIAQGQPVGAAGFALVGTPGLYFELRVDGRPVDPLQWLRNR